MRPEPASHSGRVSGLLAKHVKVFVVGGGGDEHLISLSGTMHGRPQICLFYSDLQKLNLERTVRVEFLQVAQDLRDHLVMLTHSPVGCRGQRNGRKMKSRRGILLSFTRAPFTFAANRRVSTTLRQVFTKFSEFFICCQFSTRKFASGSPRNDDRQIDGPTACPFWSPMGAHCVFPKSIAAGS